MKNKRPHYIFRTLAVFLTAGFLIASFGGASIVGPLSMAPVRHFSLDPVATQTMKELSRVGLLKQLSQSKLEELLTYQIQSGKSLAEILKEPKWLEILGLSASTFKATWYSANTFDLLPVDMQIAIRRHSTPFKNRVDMVRWMKKLGAPARWKVALEKALIETTAENLWRASRGKRPYAKNGQCLQPIVVEKAKGTFEVHDGHIATDPRIIPTNSRVLILVRIKGQEKILRVKATDIGSAIKGHHVDLPIEIKPRYGKEHSIKFPGKYISNPNVLILSPAKKSNRDRKVSSVFPQAPLA